MKRQSGLKKETIAQIHSVLERHPQVEKAILYGSRAKGNFKPGSDVDLALVGQDDLDTKTLHRIMDEIEELLLPYTFDLSIYHQISDPDVIDHIRRVGIVFYQKAEKTSGG